MTMPAEADAPRRIHITGVSDTHNFGDALFPLIAAHRLGSLGYEVVAASPTGRALDWPDAMPSVRLDRVISGEEPSQGLLLGGGHLILADVPAELFGRHEGYGPSSIPSLWLGASLASALWDIPVAWNAPGVFGPMMQPELRAASRAAIGLAGYAAVRDGESRAFVDAQGEYGVAVAPDTALDVASLWPRRDLEAAFRRLLQRKGVVGDRPWLTLHFRRIAMEEAAIAALAEQVSGVAEAQGLAVAFLAIGPGVGDDRVAQAVSRRMRVPHLLLDDPASLREITALLAHSAIYAGNSLHGYVAAAAYGVPGLLIDRPPARRFRGFLHYLGRPQDLAAAWAPALDRLAGRRADHASAGTRGDLAVEIDRHWTRIAQCLDTRHATGMAQRLSFLSAYTVLGLRRAGSAWGLEPFASREFHLGRAMSRPREREETAHVL